MGKITLVATTVIGNEKATWLLERHEKTPDERGFHRYQRIYVIRDGCPAEFRRDMGDARNYKGVNEITIPSFLEYTVDELMDMADEIRGQVKIDIKDLFQVDKYKTTV